MEQRLLGESAHVEALDGVVDPVTLAAHGDEARESQFGQVLGDPRRVHTQVGGEFVDRMLAVQQGPHDAQPRAIREQFQRRHGQVNLSVGRLSNYLRSHIDNGTTWPCAVAAMGAACCGVERVTCETSLVTTSNPLLRRGLRLEYATLAWNVVGLVVLAWSAIAARSVALAGFGLDSFIEIGASIVVVWELTGVDERRQRRALRLIAGAFALLALYLLIQGTVVLALRHHAGHSVAGIVWTALTALAMFSLAWGKARTGRALGNPVLESEGRVTLVDGILATAVLVGLALNAALGWWWADPVAGFVLVYYALREFRAVMKHESAS